jgi:hypothetical protein
VKLLGPDSNSFGFSKLYKLEWHFEPGKCAKMVNNLLFIFLFKLKCFEQIDVISIISPKCQILLLERLFILIFIG